MQPAVTVYGLRNCDSCRKAWRWLDSQNIAYAFHDVRRDGLDEARITGWFALLDWQQLVNKRSKTWRSLSDAQRANLDKAGAPGLLVAHPALLRRPVIEAGGTVTAGFSEAELARLFNL